MASRSMLRSPSHESDLSSLASGSANHRVTFATANKSSLGGGYGTHSPRRPTNIPEIFWLEEDGNHLLKSCAKLSDAVGIPKSFSTSDINEAVNEKPVEHLRTFVSELALCSFQRCGFLVDYPNRLEQTSRSCSTWVAVGELASQSQLPSPHGTHSINSLQFSNNALSASNVPVMQGQSPGTAAFSSVDLIRNINKKARKNYIRRKILMTYRALERMSQSEFNLDRLVAAANEQLEEKKRIKKRGPSPGPTELVVPNLNELVVSDEADQKTRKVEAHKVEETSAIEPKPSCSVAEPAEQQRSSLKLAHGLNKNMTMCDIELERGRSLSKYERNMMIFNWLHSLVLPLPLEDPPI